MDNEDLIYDKLPELNLIKYQDSLVVLSKLNNFKNRLEKKERELIAYEKFMSHMRVITTLVASAGTGVLSNRLAPIMEKTLGISKTPTFLICWAGYLFVLYYYILPYIPADIFLSKRILKQRKDILKEFLHAEIQKMDTEGRKEGYIDKNSPKPEFLRDEGLIRRYVRKALFIIKYPSSLFFYRV